MFMDMESYEEVRLPRDDAWAVYLKEGTDCDVVFFNGDVISVDPPVSMVLEVTQCDVGVKGNTAKSGASKPATLETGAVVMVRSLLSVSLVLLEWFRWCAPCFLFRWCCSNGLSWPSRSRPCVCVVQRACDTSAHM